MYFIFDISKVENRPTGFKGGFFVNDFIYDGSGDLDIHNGRFCKTPEFPNGTYYYVITDEFPGIPRYFVGIPSNDFKLGPN